MEALIFSKNRPMQLELTLHSHEVFWGEKITVLYKATEAQYQKGYDELSTAYPQVNFVQEDNFKAQVVEYVKRNKYVVFFCDDDVMIRSPRLDGKEWELFELISNGFACLSLRLDPKYDKHFETGKMIPCPRFFRVIHDGIKYCTECYIWNWQKAEGDWGFPMSVLGHIFRRKDLLPLVRTLIYNSPNQLESALADNPLSQPNMMCLYRACNINIPANMVQTTHTHNKAGKVSVAGLNERFLAGERIDLDDVIEKTKDARSCFMLIKFKFISNKELGRYLSWAVHHQKLHQSGSQFTYPVDYSEGIAKLKEKP